MPSALSWLDASAEDQRRMREIVGLFSTIDSRDELGIGQVRDVLSDALFPGTSVLITRARYLLFVPWCFQQAAASGRPGAEARLDRNERDLIVALRDAGTTDGLLGAQAGRGLKTLPSSTYWNSIRRWQILRDGSVGWQDALATGRSMPTVDEEQTTPPASPWSGGLPSAPTGFPQEAPGGFDLTWDESQWLTGRILTSCDATLLAHLAVHRPEADSAFPWTDRAALSSPAATRLVLEQARVFSHLVHGAALLYNLLLAEAYTDAGFDRLGDQAKNYRELIATWEAEREASTNSLQRWRFDDLRDFVRERNPAVRSRTWSFLRSWSEIAAPGNASLADSPVARAFIADRERQHKGGQSRLRNRGLLGSWSGAAGSGAIAFRWGAVRRILLDIHDGLERGRA